MSSTEIADVSLQEKVPKVILRTDDDFSSGSDEDDKGSQISEEIEDMDIDHGEEFESKGNPGWADAMAKILKTNAPKGKETIVLAKAKKISDVIKEKNIPNIGFEIEGEVKEEKPNLDSVKEEPKQNANLKHVDKMKKRDWKLKARVKPSVLEKNRERTLAKIATKGVVQLFNTVRNHQKNIDRQLNDAGSQRKREKVLQSIDKQSFLDMLMGSKNTEMQTDDSIKTDVKEEDPWHVLRDDFMMGGTMKDWDKKMDSPNLTIEIKDDKEEVADSDVNGNKDKDDSDASDVGDDDDDDADAANNDDDDNDVMREAFSDNSPDDESSGDG